MKLAPLFFFAMFASPALHSTQTWANDTMELFECSVLADWADFGLQSKRLAELGYELGRRDVGQAIEFENQASSNGPSFIQTRSPDFWIGMWYGRSQAKIEEWLQTRVPVTIRPDAAAPERVKIALQKITMWKPVAAEEFEQRACNLRLAGKD